MLAILEQWDLESGFHTDNIMQFAFLVLMKLGVDTASFCFYSRKLCASFLCMCSLSIVLADMVMMVCMATVWLLGSDMSPMSPCFLLAFSSATYGKLPLPMMCLSLLDYFLKDTCIDKQSTLCKPLRNIVLTFLVWTQAGIYSYGSVTADVMEVEYGTGIKALVCQVEDDTLITYFGSGLFIVVICSLLTFWSIIPRWISEADRLWEETIEQEKRRSDLLFTSTPCTETRSGMEDDAQGIIQRRPPLWFSLTLGFSVIWMPYLTLSVACLLFSILIPAYFTVNILWLECANSVLVGLMFWIKSKMLAPYTNQPKNMCLWQVNRHLSKGGRQEQLPVAVLNPSQTEKKALLMSNSKMINKPTCLV